MAKLKNQTHYEGCIDDNEFGALMAVMLHSDLHESDMLVSNQIAMLRCTRCTKPFITHACICTLRDVL